jgi:hypothetical protein
MMRIGGVETLIGLGGAVCVRRRRRIVVEAVGRNGLIF